MTKDKKIVIAIDGYSSCGKSTVAKEIAKRLKYSYVDTGAMYRAITHWMITQDAIQDGIVNEEYLKQHIADLHISFQYDEKKLLNVTYLNNINIEDSIRAIKVSSNVSKIASFKFVREYLTGQQRQMGKQGGVVMDGRDIGSVVFPKAELKIFMTAKPEIRAQRRFDELKEKDETITYEEVLKNLQERDHMDSTREESPLVKAKDAIVLDNSDMNREEQLQWILEKVKKIVEIL